MNDLKRKFTRLLPNINPNRIVKMAADFPYPLLNWFRSRVQQDKFFDEIIDYIAITKWSGKSIVLWGWEPTVVSAIIKSNILNDINSVFVSESYPVQDIEECKITQEYFNIDRNYKKPEELHKFKPDKVCILYINPYKAIHAYETLLREFNFDPMDIYCTTNIWKVSNYMKEDRYDDLVKSVPKNIVGGLMPKSRLSLYDGLRYIINNNIPGNIINYGVSRGWSIYFIAEILEKFGDTDRKIIGFDGFTGFPLRKSKFDLCNLRYANYNKKYTSSEKQRLKKMTEINLSPHIERIELVAGDIYKTIAQLPDDPIALALFDMDDYTPTKVSLEPTYEKLSNNGVFILDHFTYDTIGGFCLGQRLAMLEFLEAHEMFNLTGSNMFFKTNKM